jgi:hypothetical protein
VDKWFEPAIRPREVRADIDHRSGRQWTVQMREEHRRGIARVPGLPEDWGAEQVRVEEEQHQVDAAGEEPIGGPVHLMLR